MAGRLEGDYWPLAHSTSYLPKPSGMSQEVTERLSGDRFLFDAPDNTLLLCSGVGRDWPDARGVLVALRKDLVCWANEEEHLRVMSSNNAAGGRGGVGGGGGGSVLWCDVFYYV